MKAGRRDPACEPDTLRASSPIAASANHTQAPIPLSSPRYDDLGFIGEGGQGQVRRVHDRLMGRTLAMKILSQDWLHDERARTRFINEARVTASLQHPGIVPVHDMGRLADERPYFTMKEVRGRTLSAHIAALHQMAPHPDKLRLALRRLLEALTRACDALAYAHSRGIVHRDIKPQNMMVGRFGEVQVMDWGLAVSVAGLGLSVAGKAEGAAEKAEGAAALAPTADRQGSSQIVVAESLRYSVDTALMQTMALPDDALRTRASRYDDVAGTLVYMPPEQARGDVRAMGLASDVYALGAVIYQVLVGQPPYLDRPHIWSALLSGPPRSLASFEPDERRPPELCAICDKAMRREPRERYSDAGQLGRALQDWLDDTQRHERARRIVDDADAQWFGTGQQSGIAALTEDARALRQRAAELLGSVHSYDPVSNKARAWQLEDQAAELERAAAVRSVKWQQTLRSALNEVADLAAAHQRLADYYQRRLEEAEARREREQAARAEALLRTHDRGRHSAYLRGDATLTVVTEPAGAEIQLLRYEWHGRRLVPRPVRILGSSPLVNVNLTSGSYLLVLHASGCRPVRHPVLLPRAGSWEGIRPGSIEPTPVWLPPATALRRDEVYVPAGWFISGGDPHAVESLPRRRHWADALVVKRHPVTCAEYLIFLNALVDAGDEEAAWRHAPKLPLGHANNGHSDRAWPRDRDGRFVIADGSASTPQPNWPVTLVNWHDGCAYADWYSATTGQPWRLPGELEWEKTARSVDGRLLPWGDFFEPTFANVIGSHNGPQNVIAVREPKRARRDRSAYGICGLAGNVRQWCIDSWERDGPPVEGNVLVWRRATGDALRSVRGGAWTSAVNRGRPASRFAAEPDFVFRGLGFRLVRSCPQAADVQGDSIARDGQLA